MVLPYVSISTPLRAKASSWLSTTGRLISPIRRCIRAGYWNSKIPNGPPCYLTCLLSWRVNRVEKTKKINFLLFPTFKRWYWFGVPFAKNYKLQGLCDIKQKALGHLLCTTCKQVNHTLYNESNKVWLLVILILKQAKLGRVFTHIGIF